MDGKVRLFDISAPFQPKPVYEKVIGSQVNMLSQSWDGKRLYFTSSLLANWDKKGKDNEQFLKAYEWNGEELEHKFTVDFHKEKLGRAHLMHFGAYSLYD
jgi:selenium-binding protein 1